MGIRKKTEDAEYEFDSAEEAVSFELGLVNKTAPINLRIIAPQPSRQRKTRKVQKKCRGQKAMKQIRTARAFLKAKNRPLMAREFVPALRKYYPDRSDELVEKNVYNLLTRHNESIKSNKVGRNVYFYIWGQGSQIKTGKTPKIVRRKRRIRFSKGQREYQNFVAKEMKRMKNVPRQQRMKKIANMWNAKKK